jgi:membrane-bound serine protease (ClpP class)
LILLTLWVAKDIALFPWLRSLERTRPKTGHEGLIGQIGVTRSLLEPTGYVFLRGELWRAEAAPEEFPLPSGIEVQVEKINGLTLQVRRASIEPA